MQFTLKNEAFDTMMIPSDWRYSAAITGLVWFLDYFKIPYDIALHEVPGMNVSDTALLFRRDDVTEERYIGFVENRFNEELQPCLLETYLQQEVVYTDEEIKGINDLLNGPLAPTAMKKVFAKKKYTPESQGTLLQLLLQHKSELIKETYRNKRSLYYNFANPNNLGKEAGDACRLNGFYVDVPKKGKSQGYGFDKNRMDSEDSIFFDFIPFAFAGGRQKFFWNNSVDIKAMVAQNAELQYRMKRMKQEATEAGKKVNELKVFWEFITYLMNQRSYNVEVITKVQDEDFFKTLFIRKTSADILKTLRKERSNGKMAYDVLAWSYPLQDGKTYINFQELTIQYILNLAVLDPWIEYFLREGVRCKDTKKFHGVLYQWIRLNVLIRAANGEAKMEQKKIVSNVYIARRCAATVSYMLPENKLNSYRTKLTSSLIYHDYDRFCETLLQLSNYTKIPFDFAYALFTNFEDHKDIAYAFVEALDKKAGKSLELANSMVEKDDEEEE